MLRTRYTDEDKARLLGEFDAGGGSAAAFCRERGISYQTFITWRRGRRVTRRKAEAPVEFVEFVELALGPAAGRREQAGPRVELELGGGIVLRVHLPIPHR